MARETKAAADDAIARFYGSQIDLSDGDEDVPPDTASVMVKVGDIRAIIRDRNALERIGE